MKPISSVNLDNTQPPQDSSVERKSTASTEPKKELPKSVKAFKDDIAISFDTLKHILLAPFVALFQMSGGTDKKPQRTGMDIAEAVLWTALLPATLPSAILATAIMSPIALVSATFAAATGKVVKMPESPRYTAPPDESVDRI